MANESRPLYLDDFYRVEAPCRIVDAASDERGPYVVPDETLFYPQGGGQKGDRGELAVDDMPGLEVIDTRKNNGEVRLYVTVPGGRDIRNYDGCDAVQRVDWPFRYHQMKMHSAAHFLHGALEQIAGETLPYPVRAPLSETGGECHYEFVDKFDEAGFKKATEAMNAYMAEGHTITTHPEEQHGPGFRSWRCEDQYILCGGLHPTNSTEVGRIAASMRVKRGKTLVAFWPETTND